MTNPTPCQASADDSEYVPCHRIDTARYRVGRYGAGMWLCVEHAAALQARKS